MGCFTTARNSYGSPLSQPETVAEKSPDAVMCWNGVDFHSPLRSLVSRPFRERYSNRTSTDLASPSECSVAERVTPEPERTARVVSTRGGLSAGWTSVIFSTSGFGQRLLSCNRCAKNARICRPSDSCFHVVFGTILLYS